MDWTGEQIIEKLKHDYVSHFNRYHHFEQNDNDVDKDWESAVMDYIFDLLVELTGGTPSEVADSIDEILEHIFVFNPQDNPELWEIKENEDYIVCQDIPYCSVEDFECMFEDIERDYLAKEVLGINYYNNEVFIPKGTKMTYKGCDVNGWPIFYIHDFGFDFAGPAFKLKKAE